MQGAAGRPWDAVRRRRVPLASDFEQSILPAARRTTRSGRPSRAVGVCGADDRVFVAEGTGWRCAGPAGPYAVGVCCAAIARGQAGRPDRVRRRRRRPPGTHVGYYVVFPPYGTSAGTGTTDDPWDLATALAGGHGRMQPGDTVWIRGGAAGTWGASRRRSTGTAGAPIVFRQYPGERATIDGSLAAGGSYLVFWGFEIMQSHPTAIVDRVLEANTVNGKFINLVLHDAGFSGVSMAADKGAGVELYGSIVYNNGFRDNIDHGIYAHNATTGTKYITDNVFFNNFARGIQVYEGSATDAPRLPGGRQHLLQQRHDRHGLERGEPADERPGRHDGPRGQEQPALLLARHRRRAAAPRQLRPHRQRAVQQGHRRRGQLRGRRRAGARDAVSVGERHDAEQHLRRRHARPTSSIPVAPRRASTTGRATPTIGTRRRSRGSRMGSDTPSIRGGRRPGWARRTSRPPPRRPRRRCSCAPTCTSQAGRSS